MVFFTWSSPLIVALLLSEGGLQAQPLAETYKRQEELRLRVADICYSQFEKALYLPVEGQLERKEMRFMISAKGVQAITASVIPAGSGGSYKCDRGGYEQPMLLGRTYRRQTQPHVLSSKWTARCRLGVSRGVVAPSECASVRKERLELEACSIGYKPTTCLVSYIQFDSDLVTRRFLAVRSLPQLE